MPAVVDSLTLLIRLGYTFTDDIGTTGAGPIHLHRNRWIFPLDTASLITLYVLAGLVIGQGVLVVWFTCALWRWKRPLLADAAAPPAAIILCLRGSDPFLSDCLAGLSRQDYPNFQLHVIIDHPEDEARDTLDAFVQRCAGTSDEAVRRFAERLVVHFLATPLETCSLKCSSLLQVVETLDPEIQFIAQLDADAVPHPTWLRELATALQDDRVGAATGNRWYMPATPSLAALIRYAWNAAAVVQMFSYRIPWGGTLAVKTRLLRDDDLLNKWQHSFCEDTPLFSYLKSRRLRVAFVPSLLMTNREDCTLGGFFHWVKRQLLTARLHHPAWPAVVGHGVVTTVVPLFAIGLFVAAVWQRDAAGQFYASAGVIGYGIGILGLLIPMEVVARRIVRGRGQDASWTSMFDLAKIAVAVPLTTLVYAVALTSACRMKRTVWRGIEYEIQSGKRVRMLGYHPYVPPAQIEQPVSL